MRNMMFFKITYFTQLFAYFVLFILMQIYQNKYVTDILLLLLLFLI